MCLIAWSWQPGSETPLLLLGNRDEFYARPTLPLHWWEGGSMLAGRDLQGGGTWLGVGPGGRLAALTNYRLPVNDAGTKPSRGTLVADFLSGNMDSASCLEGLTLRADEFNPFNLLVFDGTHLMGLESRRKRVFALEAGLGAVSNADFDTPWPKLVRLKQGLEKQSAVGLLKVQDLLPLLQDTRVADDSDLPRTGISLDQERLLSAAMVQSPHYGTRASSIVVFGRKTSYFFEQSYDQHRMLASVQHSFTPSLCGPGSN